jgi:hypothetical protein
MPDVSELVGDIQLSTGAVDDQEIRTVFVLGSAYYREIYNAQAAKLQLSCFLCPDDKALDRYTLSSPSAGQDPIDGQHPAPVEDTGPTELSKSSIKDKVKRVLRKSASKIGLLTKTVRKSKEASPQCLPGTAVRNVLIAKSLEENLFIGGWSPIELPEAYAPVGLVVPSCIAATVALLMDLSK